MSCLLYLLYFTTHRNSYHGRLKHIRRATCSKIRSKVDSGVAACTETVQQAECITKVSGRSSHLAGLFDGGQRQPVSAHQLVPQHAFVPQLHHQSDVHTSRLTTAHHHTHQQPPCNTPSTCSTEKGQNIRCREHSYGGTDKRTDGRTDTSPILYAFRYGRGRDTLSHNTKCIKRYEQ